MKNQSFTFKEFLNEIYEKPQKLHEAYFAFHNYSLSNCWLAMSQLGKAEPINTFKGWKEIGRNVKKGEKAIKLLMPVNRKFKKKIQENGEEKEQEYSFTQFIERPFWFGLSQTEGEEIAFDTFPNFNLEKALNELGIKKEVFQMVNGNCQGYAYPNLKTIAINPLAFSPFKTSIHEIAHCLLHSEEEKIIDNENLSNGAREFEAEATAYLVCCALGKTENLESSRAYIAGWLNKTEAKESYFKRAFNAANTILKAGKQNA